MGSSNLLNVTWEIIYILGPDSKQNTPLRHIQVASRTVNFPHYAPTFLSFYLATVRFSHVKSVWHSHLDLWTLVGIYVPLHELFSRDSTGFHHNCILHIASGSKLPPGKLASHAIQKYRCCLNHGTLLVAICNSQWEICPYLHNCILFSIRHCA